MANIYSGKTVEEALASALADLGITEENAVYEVLEQPTKGIFGIGAKPAKISVSKKKSDVEEAAEFLDGLFSILGVGATTEITENTDERATINLVTTDSSSVIGYRGEILDSLQSLAGAVANKNNDDYKRVVVDCEGYRSKREITLKHLAERLAVKARKTGRKIALEPMNPYERRIIHSALVDFEGVKTVSEGKDPARFIAIIPDGYDPSKDRRSDKNSRGDRRNGRNDRRGSYDRRRSGGGSGEMRKAPKKSGFGGGVFLGNSLKNAQAETEKDE